MPRQFVRCAGVIHVAQFIAKALSNNRMKSSIFG